MDYGNKVDDRPIQLGGSQCIRCSEDVVMPLDIIKGLAYLKIRRPTDTEMATLEPFHMTSNADWDPSIYDSAPSADHDWFAALADSTLAPQEQEGTARSFARDYPHLYESDFLNDLNTFQTYKVNATRKPIDYESMRPYFLGVPADIVRRTYDSTTQYYSNFSHREGQVHMYQSPFPAANVCRRSEDESTDTFHADTVAWGGYECMQIFVGSVYQWL